MLAGLARRLRLMGYDVELARPGEGLTAMMKRAREQGRLAVVASRREMPGKSADIGPASHEDDLIGGGVAFGLTGEGVDEQARQVYRRFPIDLDRLALTRCSRDNALLEELAAADVAAQLPERVRGLYERIRRCPDCGRLYWPGTHYNRIVARNQDLTQSD